ncbi:MAG: SGNH/GDSL hydrolase family protein, partial [Actinobacteria bacterium]|nr:SGNH/GDSL hydrolase family protein [Actinomycetota bacterium]
DNNLVLFPYNIFFDIQIRQYNQVISKVAQKYEVNLIDLYTPTKNDFANRTNFYSVDDFHPSGEGYKMWGTLITSKDL